MSPRDPTSTATSPRYNLIWIGVLVMLVSSFVELACQWRLLYAGMRPMVLRGRNAIRARRGKTAIVSDFDEPAYDPMPKSAMVPFWGWFGMFIISIALTLIIRPSLISYGLR